MDKKNDQLCTEPKKEEEVTLNKIKQNYKQEFLVTELERANKDESNNKREGFKHLLDQLRNGNKDRVKRNKRAQLNKLQVCQDYSQILVKDQLYLQARTHYLTTMSTTYTNNNNHNINNNNNNNYNDNNDNYNNTNNNKNNTNNNYNNTNNNKNNTNNNYYFKKMNTTTNKNRNNNKTIDFNNISVE